jgi:hypothetical protein
MSSKIKLKEKRGSKRSTYAMVDPKMPSYENDPFFVKKAKEAKLLIKKVGLPPGLEKKK